MFHLLITVVNIQNLTLFHELINFTIFVHNLIILTKQGSMKNQIFLLTILIILTPSFLRAQSSVIPPEISLAFRAGNVEKLSEYLNSTIELVILDKEDFYNRSTAETILKDFFSNHQTLEFIIKHQGGKNDTHYAIGSLKTRNGNFRVYFLVKEVDNKPLIHQLRIEKDGTENN